MQTRYRFSRAVTCQSVCAYHMFNPSDFKISRLHSGVTFGVTGWIYSSCKFGFQVCGGASEELEHVWAKWRGQRIRATGCQPLPVAGWLLGASRGAGCPFGPPHRLLHRPVRRGGRVHQKVGPRITASSSHGLLPPAGIVAHHTRCTDKY